jgi:hypothetical protein
MNTPIEAMNRVIKHSNLSVGGSFNMASAARTIDEHSAALEREKNIISARALNSIPIYTKCTLVFPHLNRVSQHEFDRQYVQRGEYEWVQVATDRWWVKRRTHTVKPGCKIPRFLRLRKVTLSQDNYLYCDCGYYARYGIPCRHVLSIDPTYQLRDFSIRWWKVYDYFAFREGSSDLTKQFLELDCQAPPGKHSGLPSLPADTIFPILSDVSLSYDRWLAIHDHPGPICLNYKDDKYVDPAKHGNLEVDGLPKSPDQSSDDDSAFDADVDPMGVDLTQESWMFEGDDEGATGFSISEEAFVSEVKSDEGKGAYFTLRPYFHSLVSLVDDDDRWTLFAVEKMRKIQKYIKREMFKANPRLKVPEDAEFVSVHHVGLNRTKKRKFPSVAI